MLKFFKKYHKWLGLFFALFLILYSLSGIVLNHRDLLSGVDVSRKLMPKSYTFDNYNLASLRGSQQIGKDSILLYGNMGIWIANDNLKNLEPYNIGLPDGMDNQKIYKVYLSEAGNLYLASLRGCFELIDHKWQKLEIQSRDQRFVDIAEKDGDIYFLSRSYIFKTTDESQIKDFEKIQLLNHKDYDDKISLFKTLWFIHSGEIYGHIGKLLVDLLGLVFIFLSIGGVVFFFMPRRIKKVTKKGGNANSLKGFHKWNIKWHNKLGYWFIFFLLITTITGIFLRPPGLIFIATSKVGKIPLTTLATPNGWFDKFRAFQYDKNKGNWLLLTDAKAYKVDENFENPPIEYDFQVPISIMGVNVLESIDSSTWIVGSFSGIYIWNPDEEILMDAQTNKEYVPVKTVGPPIKNSSITGYVEDGYGNSYYTEYTNGIAAFNPEITAPKMPQTISQLPISIWNLALEIHTARYFSFLFGMFYILIVPLVGFATIFILISGFIVWWKKYK